MKKYFTKTLLLNILLALVIIVVLLLLVQLSLKSYTRHGESVDVPDLKGVSFEKAVKLLDDKNLEWQIIDSIFDSNKPPLSVVDQNPKSGSKVKYGRTIYITINATNAPTTELPDLIGRSSFKYAKMQLESFGLKVGEPIYRPDPHFNSVIGMEVNGVPVDKKTRVAKGTTITLVLGDGIGGSSIQIPYLIGLRFDEAEFKLKGYSLNVGALVVKDGVSDTSGAVVYKQVPAFGLGKTIRIGEPIDLFIAKELPEGIVVDPTLYNIAYPDSSNKNID